MVHYIFGRAGRQIGNSAVLLCIPHVPTSDVRNGRMSVEEDMAQRRSAVHHIGRVLGRGAHDVGFCSRIDERYGVPR